MTSSSSEPASAPTASPVSYRLEASGAVPNNPRCPVLVYAAVAPSAQDGERDSASYFEALFDRHDWGNGWRNGIFPYHHFHSTAHEVLGIYSGWAEVVMGGENGMTLTVKAGDVVVVPAGVAHKKIRSGEGFACVGAYPLGQVPDQCRPGSGDRVPRAQAAAVEAVPLPGCDPVFGPAGPLLDLWR